MALPDLVLWELSAIPLDPAGSKSATSAAIASDSIKSMGR